MKQSVKRWLGRFIFGSRLNAVLLANAAVVVAFHRVQETDEDGLTVSRSTFAGYCEYFAHHFHVVSLAELVSKLERGQDVARHLAITFDDGYRDNFENAAPVLQRLSLPATFFVVSRWIESDVVPWWDRQGGVRYPWMTWEQVRWLHRNGFDIGGHTRTHVDLGKASGNQAIEEILGGRLDLEQQIGAPVQSFAYPYGQQQHLAPANRELVKAAGFRCCCSCFGGVNMAGADPFELARVPISPWYASTHQFGFEVAVGTSVVSDQHLVTP